VQTYRDLPVKDVMSMAGQIPEDRRMEEKSPSGNGESPLQQSGREDIPTIPGQDQDMHEGQIAQPGRQAPDRNASSANETGNEQNQPPAAGESHGSENVPDSSGTEVQTWMPEGGADEGEVPVLGIDSVSAPGFSSTDGESGSFSGGENAPGGPGGGFGGGQPAP